MIIDLKNLDVIYIRKGENWELVDVIMDTNDPLWTKVLDKVRYIEVECVDRNLYVSGGIVLLEDVFEEYRKLEGGE